MKIKRTKTGTKTSEAKHEIVKAEQNGATTSSDEGTAATLNNKKHSQIPVSPVPGSPIANKRGTSGHRKDKVRISSHNGSPIINEFLFYQKQDKISHSQRDKSDLSANSTGNDRNICGCGSEMTTSGLQSTCTNMSCVKSRSNEMSLAQRLQANPISSR
jgi:hypothetical protein